MSTADGLGFSLPVRPAAASISLPRAAFDVANAGGVTHTQIMVVQLIPPLEIVDVDSGDPRNSFNISGNNLILQPGERPGVTFVLTDKHFDDRHPPRIVATGSCEIFGQPAPDLVTVVVRELEGLQGEFILELNVSRPDGAEASGEQRLVLI
jgi:hypothetical protein